MTGLIVAAEAETQSRTGIMQNSVKEKVILIAAATIALNDGPAGRYTVHGTRYTVKTFRSKILVAFEAIQAQITEVRGTVATVKPLYFKI